MHFVKFCRTAITPVLIFACVHSARAEQDKIAPCREDAMIVFDASGSMSGNQTLGVPNSQARIDVLRSALAQVLPSATRLRKVGLITFGPGPAFRRYVCPRALANGERPDPVRVISSISQQHGSRTQSG